MAKQIQFLGGLLWVSPRQQTMLKVIPKFIAKHDPQKYVTSGLESVPVFIKSD
jgi:hypothetical protein